MIAYLRRKEYEGTDGKIVPYDDVFPVLYNEVDLTRNGVYVRGENILDMDVLYFRAVGSAYETVNSIIRIAKARGIPIIDKYLDLNGAGPRTKEYMHTTLDVPQPAFAIADRLNNVIEAARGAEITYPYVAKVSKGGRQGLGTFLITQEDDIRNVRTELERRYNEEEGHAYNLGRCDWIVQEHIPNGGDYRAFVLGDECIGITKRGPKLDGLVMNKSEHGSRRFRNGRWPRDIGRLAVRASREMDVDIAGVDIVRHSRTRQSYIIEVNEAPRFDVFSKATGIDVGLKIVEYLRGRANEREQA